jgi:hypothetical protein
VAKRYEQRTRTVEEAVCVESLCDLCGAKARNDDRNFSKSYHQIDEATVQLKSGDRYCEFIDIDTIEYIICPDCFRNKLMPWLKEQGAEPETKNISD